MIVKLQRPKYDDGFARWSLFDDTGLVDFIEPTVELRQRLTKPWGYFEAEMADEGWWIGESVVDQAW